MSNIVENSHVFYDFIYNTTNICTDFFAKTKYIHEIIFSVFADMRIQPLNILSGMSTDKSLYQGGNMMDIERDIIRRFRVTSKYKGYLLIIEALHMYIEMYYQNISISMSGTIYKNLAEKYNTTVFCVEHNIRTLIERCWKNNRNFMEELFGGPLTCCPSNRDFIDSVAYYVISYNKDNSEE